MEFLEWAKKHQWDVDKREETAVLPEHVSSRYTNLPQDWTSFFQSLETCASDEGEFWFLTLDDYENNDDDMMFCWNYMEQICEKQAEGDDTALKRVQSFWDLHFPIAFDVGSPSKVYAIALESGEVVVSEEPDFFSLTTVASSFSAFLEWVMSSSSLS